MSKSYDKLLLHIHQAGLDYCWTQMQPSHFSFPFQLHPARRQSPFCDQLIATTSTTVLGSTTLHLCSLSPYLCNLFFWLHNCDGIAHLVPTKKIQILPWSCWQALTSPLQSVFNSFKSFKRIPSVLPSFLPRDRECPTPRCQHKATLSITVRNEAVVHWQCQSIHLIIGAPLQKGRVAALLVHLQI